MSIRSAFQDLAKKLEDENQNIPEEGKEDPTEAPNEGTEVEEQANVGADSQDESQNSNESEETPSGSPTENDQVSAEPSQEGGNIPDEPNEPYNKNPRFKELVDAKNEYKKGMEDTQRMLSEALQVINSLKSEKTEQSSQQQAESIKAPKSITDLLGDDPEAVAEFINFQKVLLEERLKEERQKADEESRAIAEQKQREERYLADQITKINETYGKNLEVGNSEYNEFARFYLEKPIRDKDNNYDLVSGYDLFMKIKAAEELKASAVTNAKKAIAANTGSQKAAIVPSKQNSEKLTLREILAKSMGA